MQKIIDNGLLDGSPLCVSREILSPEMPNTVRSVYVMNNYMIRVEFDIIDSVGSSEGWKWLSSPMSLDDLIFTLERYLGEKVIEWENIDKTKKLEYSPIRPDISTIEYEDDLVRNKYQQGKLLLPELPLIAYWAVTPSENNVPLYNFESYLKLEKTDCYRCSVHIKTRESWGEFDSEIYEDNNYVSIDTQPSFVSGYNVMFEIYPNDDEPSYDKFIHGLLELISLLTAEGFHYAIEEDIVYPMNTYVF